MAMMLMAGCVGQNSDGKDVTNITGPSLNDNQPRPTPSLISSAGSDMPRPIFYELTLTWDDRFHDFLIDWNKKMSWGFSQQEIDSKYERLKTGALIKYQSPSDSTLYIQNMSEFCLDLGNVLGLTQMQSEEFARTASAYYGRQRMGTRQEEILNAVSGK
jgi:hypothetical protein